jgi:CHAT domain-containing protein/tetratricopeptide (TPR) repeat protein
MSRARELFHATTVLCLGACLAFAGPAAPTPIPDEAAVRALIDAGRFDAAEPAARALIASREAADGPDSIGCAEAIDLLVETLSRSGRWAETEARTLALRAVAIKEAALGPDAPSVATSLLNLGLIQRRGGEVAESRKTLERALAIRERAFGPNDLAVADALSQLAPARTDTGDLAAGVALNERALAIRERQLGADDPAVADTLSSLGSSLRNAGDFERAIAMHQRALRIRRKALPADHPDIALTLLNLAEAMHQNGDLVGAFPLYEEAKRLREGAPVLDRPRLSEVYIDLADLYRDLGDFDAARPLYEKGHQMRVEALSEHNYITSLSHHAFALFLEAAGEPEAARRHFEAAIAICDEVLPPGHPLRAVGREDLGELLRSMGELEAARQTLQEAVDIWKAMPGPGHPFSADAYATLGGVRLDLGDTTAARPLLDRALEVLSGTIGPEHPRYGQVLLERARLDRATRKDGTALQEALRAEGILRSSLRAAARGLSEGEALRYQDLMVSGLDLAFSILATSRPGDLDPALRTTAFEALARSRALVLDEAATRHRGIVRTSDARIEGLASTLGTARRKYARLLVAGPSPQFPAAYRDSLTAARLEMEATERALVTASRAYTATQAAQNVTQAGMARALPSGTALVSYVAYRQSDRVGPSGSGKPAYVALVYRSGFATPNLVPLGPAQPIEAGIERWRAAVSSPPASAADEQTYRATAQSLRRMLWDPVVARTGGATRVLVVPDGAIHAVSLVTLVDDSGRFLVESGPTIHYLSSERDLIEAGGAPAKGQGLLALGGADFGPAEPPTTLAGDPAGPPTGAQGVAPAPEIVTRGAGAASDCAGRSALTFTPLPGSFAEAEEVRSLWARRAAGRPGSGGPVVVLTGAEASEANLIRSAPGKRVLHLATHAFFVPSRCPGGEAHTTSAGRRGTASESRLEAGTPLRVSGLALAGANRGSVTAREPGGDDGLLTGEEVASLDLSDVEWVVLSGCETGVGLARAGEGILGLRRSFQVAGARTLILSLWAVSDNDPRVWMEELYDARASGLTTAEALREASRRVIAARRQAGVTTHPYSWGAFVAAGDWR